MRRFAGNSRARGMGTPRRRPWGESRRGLHSRPGYGSGPQRQTAGPSESDTPRRSVLRFQEKGLAKAPRPQGSAATGLEDLDALKAQARAIRDRLDRLDRMIRGEGTPQGAASMKPVVDPDRCRGCGLCQRACPVQAIEVRGAAQVDEDLCIGCGHCAETCPQGAVTMVVR